MWSRRKLPSAGRSHDVGWTLWGPRETVGQDGPRGGRLRFDEVTETTWSRTDHTHKHTHTHTHTHTDTHKHKGPGIKAKSCPHLLVRARNGFPEHSSAPSCGPPTGDTLAYNSGFRNGVFKRNRCMFQGYKSPPPPPPSGPCFSPVFLLSGDTRPNSHGGKKPIP